MLTIPENERTIPLTTLLGSNDHVLVILNSTSNRLDFVVVGRQGTELRDRPSCPSWSSMSVSCAC